MLLIPAGDLLDEARRNTGLRNFDDDDFLPALDSFWKAVQTEAGLTESGFAKQRGDIVKALEVRLRTHDFFVRFPEIAEQPIVAPLIIVGPQRSGTTMLHRLLAADPQWNVLYTWQVVNPVPLGNDRPSGTDPRIRLAEEWCKERAFLQSAHYFDAHAPEMEAYFIGHGFMTNTPWVLSPSHRRWIETADFGPAYRYMRRQLQFLQWQTRAAPGRRWLLKSTSHMYCLPTVLATFPDAKLVMTHRHPKTSLGSILQLTELVQKDAARTVDRDRIRDQYLPMISVQLQRFVEFHPDRPDLFIDVPYRDLLKDALGVVRSIYELSNTPFSAESEAAILRWAQENVQHKHGKFAYNFADFGLTEADIDREFATYLAKFQPYIAAA